MAEDQSIGIVEDRQINDEMQESYLAYAMSVIVSRALPDVRDGLKPVQRRILYAMRQLGLGASTKHQKSAKVVGAVLGAFHPHSDTAVYDAMVRMAQDFSLRYPLVNGQGNFGSLDGDSAAAMRYTEARMSAPGDAMLTDIDKDTVNFVPNYDGTQEEPVVLPAALPQLLLNGALGIAVGMATSIPPHNLGEIIDALIHLIDDPSTSAEDILKFIKGPDFPTGGIIYNSADIRQAYATGRGPIVMRGKAEIIEGAGCGKRKKKGYQIVVNEIPYMVNKATLLEKIAELVKGGKIEDVSDIRDESDRDGLRVVIDLKDSAFPKKVLNRLYKFTDLQKTFHVNMIALVDGVQPKLLSLKSVLQEYIQHRQIVIVRRLRFELRRAKERLHVLEGLAIALNHIDAVIKTIKKSKSKEDAHKALRKKYKLSDRQATAILEMRLQTLAGLERKRITDELNDKKKFIKKIECILKSEKKVLGVVETELIAMRDKFADKRRTEIVKGEVGEISEEDLVPEEETIITVTHEGYIKRVDPKTYRRQHRGGKGIIGVKTRQDDFVEYFFSASTHDDLLFFTESGKVYMVKAYEVPEGSRTARGKAIVNFLELSQDEKIAAVRSLPKDTSAKYLVLVTKGGMIKRTELDQFKNIRRSGLIAMNLKKGDCLQWVQSTGGNDSILLVTEKGMSIHFSESGLRPMGRATQGVRGIALKKDEAVIGMTIVGSDGDDVEDDDNNKGGKKNDTQYFLIVTRNGYGKRTDFKEYRLQKRGGSGIKVAKISEKTGNIVSARLLRSDWSDLIVSSVKGQVIRMPLKNIAVVGRVTQGVRLIRLGADDGVAAIAAV